MYLDNRRKYKLVGILLFVSITANLYLICHRSTDANYIPTINWPGLPGYTEIMNISSRFIPNLTKSNNEQSRSIKPCTYQQRIHHIAKACASIEGAVPWGLRRYLRDTKRKLLLCAMSKSGCTTWKALWKHANNPNMSLEEYLAKPNLVHLEDKKHANGIGWHRKELSETMKQNYTKFVVVRHPFTRVLSAYYNIKYWKKNDPGPNRSLRKLLSNTFNLTINGSVPDLTFAQFVEFITYKNLSKAFYQDRHFKPFSQSCEFCNMSYDYILRLETTFDAKPVLDMLGYPEDFSIEQLAMNRKKKGTDHNSNMFEPRYLHEFKDLPSKLLDRLLNKYQADMKLFGYHYNKDTMEAGCAIRTDEGETCC